MKPKLKKTLVIVGTTILVLILLLFLSFKLSPWPSALVIRYAFNKEGKKVNDELKKHIPTGISVITDQQYIEGDKDAKLDVYYPSTLANTQELLPVIVWVHGGGWIAGSKDQLSNYCRILAAKGYCVIATDYSLAPGKSYPLPVRQTNEALAYIQRNADRFHADTSRFILAGDSGGAHIVAQTANAITEPSYATLLGLKPSISRTQLRGLILYCGPYDADVVDQDGEASMFLKTVLWSYTGKKDYNSVSGFKAASVINYVTERFPPSFISAGNGDPLLEHSSALASKLSGLNVRVDSLFFDKDLSPALPHEYQFNLDNAAGQLALENSLKFLKLVTTENR